jgi:hypothetical protein
MPSDKSRLSLNGTVHEGVRAVQAASNSVPRLKLNPGRFFVSSVHVLPRAHILCELP